MPIKGEESRAANYSQLSKFNVYYNNRTKSGGNIKTLGTETATEKQKQLSS